MNIQGEKPALFPCHAVDWFWMPKYWRKLLAWTTISIFSASFASIPLCIPLLFPQSWANFPVLMSSLALGLVLSYLIPGREWPLMRKIPQLWFEEFEFSCNISPAKRDKLLMESDSKQFIISMHPHGIIPINSLLWGAYCDYFLVSPDKKKSLYGFGCAADVVFYIPFLRNIITWFSGGSASYKSLKDGLTQGKVACVNANNGRIPKHLFILPGGIAEVFTSAPGSHVIVFKSRKGLARLSIETGAQLVPTYVFGITDVFNDIPFLQAPLSYLSRKFRMGMRPFYGQFGLPIPFQRRITMVIGDPIPVEKWSKEGPVPIEMIQELQNKYLKAIQELFDSYKSLAGYPNATLEIR